MSQARTVSPSHETPEEAGSPRPSIGYIARNVLRNVVNEKSVRAGLSLTLTTPTGGIVDVDWTLDGRFEAEYRNGSITEAKIEATEKNGVCTSVFASDSDLNRAISTINIAALESTPQVVQSSPSGEDSTKD